MKDNIVETENQVIANTYSRFPIVITKGKGCVLEDVDGREYIDFVAGIAVCNLGHSHPEVLNALSKQAGTLLHVSNLYYTV
ncbi:MAG: aminotransferase class III-fold pyridoxal phosphate-dependent enzyme, partial [Deltaproteobacteria bacterium]|nr:aminotransferase class III-fold pyridoxal phosphate-dependent enzyme [Deltaproteobacteria bacterium]